MSSFSKDVLAPIVLYAPHVGPGLAEPGTISGKIYHVIGVFPHVAGFKQHRLLHKSKQPLLARA